MVEDYVYVGENFRGDPDLPLPEGDHWDGLGKNNIITHVFLFYFTFHFYFIILDDTEI